MRKYGIIECRCGCVYGNRMNVGEKLMEGNKWNKWNRGRFKIRFVAELLVDVAGPYCSMQGKIP